MCRTTMRAVSYPADTFPVSLLTPLQPVAYLACGFRARVGAGSSSTFTGRTAGTISTTQASPTYSFGPRIRLAMISAREQMLAEGSSAALLVVQSGHISSCGVNGGGRPTREACGRAGERIFPCPGLGSVPLAGGQQGTATRGGRLRAVYSHRVLGVGGDAGVRLPAW